MRILAVALLAAGTVALGACSTPAVPVSRPPVEAPETTLAAPPLTGTQALHPVVQPALYQLPVKKTERIGDGAIVVENRGAQPIRIVKFEPVFDTHSSPGVRVLGTSVLGLDPTDEADIGVGITRAYPPVLPATNTRHESAGMV